MLFSSCFARLFCWGFFGGGSARAAETSLSVYGNWDPHSVSVVEKRERFSHGDSS